MQKVSSQKVFCAAARTLCACSTDPNAPKLKYLNSGEGLFRQGRYSESLVHFTKAVQVAPQPTRAICLAMPTLPRTNRSLPIASCSKPNSWIRRVWIPDLSWRGFSSAAAATKEADSLVQSVMQAGPANARAHGILGEKCTLSHDYPKAIAEFQKMVELELRNTENYGGLGAACRAVGRNAEAEAAYRKAIEVNPKSADAHVALGQFYFPLDSDETEAELRSACGLDARAVRPRFFLARLYALTGRLSERGHVAWKEAAPDDPQAYSALGGFYLSVGRRKDAMAEFRSFRTADPQDNSSQAFLVSTLLDLNHVEEAASLNQRMLAANAMAPSALPAEGGILTGSCRYTEAAEALEKAVQVSPHSAGAFSLPGVAQQPAGLADSARPSFTRALQIRPQMVVAATALSALSVKAGDAGQATELAERSRRAAPSAAAPYLAKASALQAKGDAPQSGAALRKALRRDPASLPVESLLLNLEIQQGRARRTIQRITTLAAQYPSECRLPLAAWIGLVQPGRIGSIRTGCPTGVAARPRNSQRGNIPCQHRVGARFGAPGQGALERGIAANPLGLLNYMALVTECEKEGNWEEAKKICEKARGDVNAAVSVAHSKNGGLPCHRRRPRLGFLQTRIGWFCHHAVERGCGQSTWQPYLPYHFGMAYLAARRPDLAGFPISPILRRARAVLETLSSQSSVE